MTRKLNSADMSAIQAAIDADIQPKKGKSGIILSIPGARYKTLVSAGGDLTPAGK